MLLQYTGAFPDLLQYVVHVSAENAAILYPFYRERQKVVLALSRFQCTDEEPVITFRISRQSNFL